MTPLAVVVFVVVLVGVVVLGAGAWAVVAAARRSRGGVPGPDDPASVRAGEEAVRRTRLPASGAEFAAQYCGGPAGSRSPAPGPVQAWRRVGRPALRVAAPLAVLMVACLVTGVLLAAPRLWRVPDLPPVAAPAPHDGATAGAGRRAVVSGPASTIEQAALGTRRMEPAREPDTEPATGSADGEAVTVASPDQAQASDVLRVHDVAVAVGDAVDVRVVDVRADTVVLESRVAQTALEAGVDVGRRLDPEATYRVEVRDDRSVVRSAAAEIAVDGDGARLDVDLGSCPGPGDDAGGPPGVDRPDVTTRRRPAAGPPR